MMQTRKILSRIHVLFVYWKTQNFSGKYNFYLWKSVQNIKDAWSATMNIFRKKIFSFKIICKSIIKLCFQNKSVHYS